MTTISPPIPPHSRWVPSATTPSGVGDPGPYVVQFTLAPGETLTGPATVCVPLGPDQNPARTDMFQTADTSGASWQGPLTRVDSADPGVICAQTTDLSIFRLFDRKGLETADRGAIAGEWLGRFGRLVAEGTMDTIGDRVRRFRDGTSAGSRNVAIGGRRFALEGGGDDARFGPLQRGDGAVVGDAYPAALRQPGAPGNGGFPFDVLTNGPGAAAGHPDGIDQRPDTAARSQPTQLSDLLSGSSFEITLGAADGAAGGPADGSAGGTLTFWGLVNGGSFTAAPGTGFDLSGDLMSGHIGVDYATRRWLFGIDLARSRGDGNFTWTASDAAAGDSIGGKIRSDLTSVHPYVAFRPGNGMSGWASLGVGRGTLTFTEIQDDGTQLQVRTNTDLRMAAGGAVVEGWRRDRLSIDVQSELFALQISSDSRLDDDDATPDMAATGVNVTQARLGLAGRGDWALSSGTRIAPSLEVQVRGDGGQVETGVGVEVGGDIRLEFGRQGLAMAGGGRYLVAHSDSDYKEWRADLTVRYDPLVAGEGVFVELSPRYGIGLSAGGDVWARRPDELVTQANQGAADRNGPAGSLTLKVGYGVGESARGWRRIEPWFGYEGPFGVAGSTMTLGGRYSSFERLELELIGQRRTDDYRGALHEINLRAMLRL